MEAAGVEPAPQSKNTRHRVTGVQDSKNGKWRRRESTHLLPQGLFIPCFCRLLSRQVGVHFHPRPCSLGCRRLLGRFLLAIHAHSLRSTRNRRSAAPLGVPISGFSDFPRCSPACLHARRARLDPRPKPLSVSVYMLIPRLQPQRRPRACTAMGWQRFSWVIFRPQASRYAGFRTIQVNYAQSVSLTYVPTERLCRFFRPRERSCCCCWQLCFATE